MFKIILFITLWLIPVYCSASSDCLREIKVKETLVRSNPTLFQKFKNQVVSGKTKMIFIDCDLYKTIKIGDELTEPGDPVDSFRLLSKDKGYLQRKHYIVLDK